MTAKVSKIFISYVRPDSEFALKLAKDLRSAGAEVWLDQLDILPGEHWDRATQRAIEACESLMIVLSPASVESANVRDELSFAWTGKNELFQSYIKIATFHFVLDGCSS